MITMSVHIMYCHIDLQVWMTVVGENEASGDHCGFIVFPCSLRRDLAVLNNSTNSMVFLVIN